MTYIFDDHVLSISPISLISLEETKFYIAAGGLTIINKSNILIITGIY